MRRILFLIFILNITPLIFSTSPVFAQKRSVTVGVVIDGPWENNDAIRKMAIDEILALTEKEFDVHFPESKQIIADWTLPGIHAAIKKELQDPQVDVVLAMGVIVSSEIARLGPFSKPVIAPFVIDAHIQNIPMLDGKSGVRNLSYISLPAQFLRDIKMFQEIVPFRKIAILINGAVGESVPQLYPLVRESLEALNAEPKIVAVEKDISSALLQLTDDIEAAYLLPLLHLNSKEFDRLVKELIERKIPSFSLLGVDEVERGIMATLSPDVFPKITRRIALNFQRILLGEKPEELPVGIAIDDRLTLNMTTARAVGVSPPFTILTEAEVLKGERTEIERKLTLLGVITEAIDKNLDIAVQNKAVAASAENIALARSALLPQVSVSALGLLIDEDRAAASNGSQAQRTLTGSANFSQLIYSDRALTNFSIQNKLQRLNEHELEILRLDIAHAAANAYLNVLRAKTFEAIQKENLKRTRSNFELAEIREQIGSSSRAEVFRWESEVAIDRKDVITANARRNVGEIALNTILHRPSEEEFILLETDLNAATIISSREKISKYLDDPVSFKILRSFIVDVAMENSPELLALDAAISAKKSELSLYQRSLWSPTFAIVGEYSTIMKEGGAGTTGIEIPDNFGISFPQADDNSWSLGLNASFPLFEGSGKFAQKARAHKELESLKLQKRSVVVKVEQRVRSATHLAGASRAGIKLSKDAAEAAAKNMELVTDAYSRGVANILDLLDAQNAALTADLAAANAVYDHMLDLMEVERAIGKLCMIGPETVHESFLKRLDDYFKKVSVQQ